MRDFTELQEKGFVKITIPTRIKELTNIAGIHLRPIQQRGLRAIANRYKKNSSLTPEESNYLFNLYFNFIACKFRYEDKQFKIKPTVNYKHIGMVRFNQLNT